MLEKLTLDIFAQHLNSQFQVESGAGPAVTLELVEANQLPAPAGYEAFSLVFRGPASSFLTQGIYHFTHSETGRFDLFIVPIRQDQGGLYYEAVFNLQRTEGQE